MERKHTKIHDGTRDLITFDNGYSASIVRHQYSYGGKSGLFEVAVEHDGELVYDTPITGDVLGYLTFREVADTLDLIAALPPRVQRQPVRLLIEVSPVGDNGMYNVSVSDPDDPHEPPFVEEVTEDPEGTAIRLLNTMDLRMLA